MATLSAVGGPAAVASYRHARDVIARHGDPVMAPWLALTTDGMLLAALVVIWVRRHRGEYVKAGPWAAFWAGMTATIAANLAAARPTLAGIVVALWPPICLAITLELVALAAYPSKQHRAAGVGQPSNRSDHVPDDAQPAPGHLPTEPASHDRALETYTVGHDSDTCNVRPIDNMPAAPAAPTGHVPTAAPAGTKEHKHISEHAVAAAETPRLSSPISQRPGPTDTSSTGTQPRHDARQNGHHDQPRARHAPDNQILAWLNEQTRATGHVPGRRQMIEKWALGSSRAERLRAIAIKDAACKTQTSTD